MELDSFVLAAVLGFHFISGSITSSQFIFDPTEKLCDRKPEKDQLFFDQEFL